MNGWRVENRSWAAASRRVSRPAWTAAYLRMHLSTSTHCTADSAAVSGWGLRLARLRTAYRYIYTYLLQIFIFILFLPSALPCVSAGLRGDTYQQQRLRDAPVGAAGALTATVSVETSASADLGQARPGAGPGPAQAKPTPTRPFSYTYVYTQYADLAVEKDGPRAIAMLRASSPALLPRRPANRSEKADARPCPAR